MAPSTRSAAASKKAAPDADVKGRAPTENPPFTIADLKNAIPAHCFKRSTFTSLRYTFQDLAVVGALFYATTFLAGAPTWLAVLLWPVYWWFQGAFMTGLWVIAHECGHRAFSDYTHLGDFVGLVLHSALLVPYHSWRISHGKHHRSTNSMEFDEVFIPYTRSQVGEHPNPAEDLPGFLCTVYRIGEISKMLLFGWPAYLLTHATGRPYGKRTNHYEPSSPLFSPREYMDIVISDIFLAAALATLGYLGATVGWLWLAKVYVVPYLLVNMWLVMITDLQHTDPTLPHYRGAAWNWLKGALCTLDRDYGYFNAVFHHIGDTHVAHHLFSHMPHYHAEEATRALKPLLGKYYLVDTVSPGLRGIAEALWKTSKFCRFVDDEGEVLWWHANKNE